ncbi:MAG: hypothetical protein ACFE8P_15760, partial [Promethearchaeota archaeon]
MSENSALSSEKMQALEEIGNLTRFKQPIPNKDETSNKGCCYVVQNNEIVELNLISSGLTALPESIEKLSSLKIINLKGNSLSNLPDSIGNLKALELLDLSSNRLTSLPDTLKNLISLKKLILTGNRGIQLPD